MAMGLPPVTSAVFLISNFGKTWVSNIWDTSTTPSRIKREWYVCMYNHSLVKLFCVNIWFDWFIDMRIRQRNLFVYWRRLSDNEELDSPAVSALGVRSRKLSNALNGQSWDRWPKPYHLALLRASEGTLSRWSQLHLQWTRVLGYGPFSL
jgi:hypothetical protein